MHDSSKQIIHIEMNFKLEVNKINLKEIKKWNEQNSRNNSGFHLTFYQIIPKEILEDYCYKLSYIENAMPDEPGSDEVIVLASEIREESNILSAIITYNNNIVGISRIFLDPDNPEYAYQGQIGIYKNFSGKGLAKWLLATTFLKLMNEYPEIKYITVDTHPSNKVMISLLERIGFNYTHTERIYE